MPSTLSLHSQPSWAASESQPSSSQTKQGKQGQGGQWQALHVASDIIRSLNLRGFKNPTPIQRASIPSALASPPRDILGMARTGSGKTLAYLIPMLQRLGSEHSTSTSPRSLIICPNRELAVQILKVGKDLARGIRKGKSSEAEGLRWALIIGGESMEAQFDVMSNKPDIVIATPGRFLHLTVEMHLDLRHVEMVIYDEADRLFEMGFDTQLREILHRLPSTRQNLLFSATLPSSVAEFAKAGLSNPLLVRLDVENKISPDLEMRFFFVKPIEKAASLLVLLQKIISIGRSASSDRAPQAIVFASTKHHVDYLTELLRLSGYRVSYIYSSLDQTARHQQLNDFRNGTSNILVVTDIAARGLDIPIMDHVINYDFPPGPRVFVHRVGRTARAGRSGTAWSLVTRDDLPYLIDLHSFLGSARIAGPAATLEYLPYEAISSTMEFVVAGASQTTPHLQALYDIMIKGQAMYERSRGKASPTAYREAKSVGRDLIKQATGVVSSSEDINMGKSQNDSMAGDRAHLLKSLATYAPTETVFEIGRRGDSATASVMKKRRELVRKRYTTSGVAGHDDDSHSKTTDVSLHGRRDEPKGFHDPAFYISHKQNGSETEKGLSLRSGASVPDSLSAAAMDLQADEGSNAKAQKASQISWDRKKRKFIQNSGNGDSGATIRSESGALLPASYSSGRFTEWKSRRRTHPAGDGEGTGIAGGRSSRFRRKANDLQGRVGGSSHGHSKRSGTKSATEVPRDRQKMTKARTAKATRKR